MTQRAASTGAGGPKGLRILVVNWLDRKNPRSGGAEIHLHETFGRLAERGHHVTVLASGFPGGGPRESLDGMDVHRVGGRHSFFVLARRYFQSQLAQRDFDVVVEDLNKVPLFTSDWGGPPVLLLVHHLFGATAFEAASPPIALGTWLLERAIPRVYAGVPVVAVSESTAEDLVHRGLEPSHITVVPNGIDLDRFNPAPESARYPTPTLAFVGRLRRYKRVDLVVRAVARLAARGLDVDFLVAGTGPERRRAERLAARLGVADRVRFLGFVSEEDKVELFRRAWIHVLPSAKEGWGISNLEAAGCGTPSVASDAPGLRESIVPGRSGLLVPHGDVDALTDALARLIEDSEERETMGSEARIFAERFTWEATADGLEAALRRVVARPGDD
jgi:glycosyltransferase involved in cell wall biosynthesis